MEIIEDAINDAKFNATENGIQNAKFFAGNCDDYIHSLVYQASSNEHLLAILDPPRAGIRKLFHFKYSLLLCFYSYSNIIENLIFNCRAQIKGSHTKCTWIESNRLYCVCTKSSHAKLD